MHVGWCTVPLPIIEHLDRTLHVVWDVDHCGCVGSINFLGGFNIANIFYFLFLFAMFSK